MKGGKPILIVALILSFLVQAQAQIAANRDKPPMKIAKGRMVEREVGVPAVRAALFSGAEALAHQGPAATSDPGLLAAYEAIAMAKARILSSRKCQKFFHDEGVQKIDQTRYTLQYLVSESRAAQVEETTVLLNRSAKGAFMNPPGEVAGLKDPREIRAFYILHELSHELSRFTGFVNDHTVSVPINRFRQKTNNEMLKLNCY